MPSLRRLGIHKVCLRRRASTSHLLRRFWCCAVLKQRFFVPARTKPESILTYFQGFGRRRSEKDRFKTVCFLMSVGLGADFVMFIYFEQCSARIALSTAMTITPTSAKIAAPMSAMPSAPSSRQANLTPRAKTMFS